MVSEPTVKRAIVFIDGQNLFYAVKEAFGYTYPNYDVLALAECVCGDNGWQLEETRFYTGIPDPNDDQKWHSFWTRKLSVMGKMGIHIYSRPLRYRNQTIVLPNGSRHTVLVGQEKGIDVRIALDVVRLARENKADVFVLFSQDQNLSEVAEEIRVIARQQDRWIKIASAFPVSPTYKNTRGINKTDWIKITRKIYDSCIDRRDYNPRKS